MSRPANANSPAHSKRTRTVPVPRGIGAPGTRVDGPDVPGPDVWGPLFDLGPDAVPAEQRSAALGAIRAYLEQQAYRFLGYQAEESLHFAEELDWLLDLHVNNIGDPFQAGNFTVNSKAVEQRVLDRFAALWRAKTPHSPDDPASYWGYVLTMGSTEGNMYALWSARDYLSGKALIVDPATADAPEHARRVVMVQAPAPADSPNAYTPVVFYSEDTHYSFTKATRLVGLPTFGELGNSRYPGECPLPGSAGTWPDEVPSLGGDAGPGTIDVDALEALVEFFAAKGHPPVVSLNVGTTFKGAYDPVAEVAERLVPLLARYGLLDRIVEYAAGHSDVRNGFWLHVDGALGAAYLPHLARAQEMGLVPAEPAVPRFDFSVPQVSSIVTSGHKWPGAPWPCGVYMTRVDHQLRPPSMPEYIGSPDTTFAGSRNGFTPVVLWAAMSRLSEEDQALLAAAAQDRAARLEQGLREVGTLIGRDLLVARSPLALTVRFLKPVDELVAKYSLSTEQFQSDPTEYAHVFVMHDVTDQRIDDLLGDLAAPGAFPPAATGGRKTAATGATATGVHMPRRGRGFR